MFWCVPVFLRTVKTMEKATILPDSNGKSNKLTGNNVKATIYLTTIRKSHNLPDNGKTHNVPDNNGKATIYLAIRENATSYLSSIGKAPIYLTTGYTEMRNQADFAKSTLNSEINLKYILLPLIMCFLSQTITRNSILNHDI